MTRLSDKQHWDDVHVNNGKILEKLLRFPLIRSILIGFHNFEFYKRCSQYITSEQKDVFEIGCAPGNYLLRFHELFWLTPGGIEYSEPGIQVLDKNFSSQGIEAKFIHGDFFDESFLESHRDMHDIVYSMGFIEHFDDTRSVIDKHFTITKPGWLVIIVIPNLSYLNKCMTEKAILDIHNRAIMNIETFRWLFEWYDMLWSGYIGWFFNLGLFQYKSPVPEKIRLVFFVFQRLLIDPIMILLSKVWIHITTRYTSPSLMMICRKR